MKYLLLILLIGCELSQGDASKAIDELGPHKANVLGEWLCDNPDLPIETEHGDWELDITVDDFNTTGFGVEFVIGGPNNTGGYECKCDVVVYGNHQRGTIQLSNCGGANGRGLPDNECSLFQNDNDPYTFERTKNQFLEVCGNHACNIFR